MFIHSYEHYKTNPAFIYRAFEQEFTVSYEKFFEDVLTLSKAFSSKKIIKGSKVMLLSDNRYGWMVTDMALVSLGGISVPRGSDTPTQELEFIMKNSGCEFLIVENEALYIKHEYLIKELQLKAIFVIEADTLQEKFGGRLRLAVSGGGTLPKYLDEWIDALGITIINSYGMTECAPLIRGRALSCDTFGTLGDFCSRV